MDDSEVTRTFGWSNTLCNEREHDYMLDYILGHQHYSAPSSMISTGMAIEESSGKTAHVLISPPE